MSQIGESMTRWIRLVHDNPHDRTLAEFGGLTAQASVSKFHFAAFVSQVHRVDLRLHSSGEWIMLKKAAFSNSSLLASAMRRIAVFIGTRPEAIKMAPVVAALEESGRFQPLVVNTGQHRELIEQVIKLFGIRVDRDLSVMEPNQALAPLLARLLERIDATLADLQPDMVLAQGDTSTVFATSLVSFYRQIPFGHVEAGLRTGNLRSPFPEEANRVLTTPLTTLHFAPTAAAADNLRRERIDESRIVVTGNTVIDALFMELQRQRQPDVGQRLTARLRERIGTDYGERPFVLITGHRRENFGSGFDRICDALGALSARFTDHLFIYPVHLNPNVQTVVNRRLGGTENIRLIEPQPYSEFVALLAACRLALSDSGGVQEEAPSIGKPVLVMRDTTERPEGIAAGTAKLVGADATKIIAETSRLLEDAAAYRAMSEAVNPYGDGHAAPRILAAIERFFIPD
jgi:UDP-N-acetylglucosamine 2-epimerase (non-hydrolysing)